MKQIDNAQFRFFEFDVPTKTKLTRKKQAILATAPWQIDIDEHLLPDERVLLERDFSIEIPRQATPPIIGESPVGSSIHLHSFKDQSSPSFPVG